jgi:hypothetical protein
MDSILRRLASGAAMILVLGIQDASAQTNEGPPGTRFLVSPGVGFGTGGFHAYGKGESKPGEYLIGRVGLARNGRPFLVAEGEFQLYAAPYPKNPDAPLDTSHPLPSGQGRDTTTAPSSRAVSLLAGVALYPAADFYVMPQVGIQIRNWSDLAEPTISETGFAAGLIAGYHLRFGPTFSMQPEFVLRYASATGPGSPSFRGASFRLMASWLL